MKCKRCKGSGEVPEPEPETDERVINERAEEIRTFYVNCALVTVKEDIIALLTERATLTRERDDAQALAATRKKLVNAMAAKWEASCKRANKAETEINRLRAVADRLPRYADTGEPIMPGSVVWILVSGKPKKDIVRLVQIDSVGEWWRGDLGYCQATYSTAKAALAAEENPDG